MREAVSVPSGRVGDEEDSRQGPGWMGEVAREDKPEGLYVRGVDEPPGLKPLRVGADLHGA